MKPATLKNVMGRIKHNCILFDLDGTITDPKVGITSSVAYALKYFGINVSDMDKLECFIGPPLKDSFMKYYGFDDIMASWAIEKYRERFQIKGIYENQLYEGITPMLDLLKCAGKTLAIATSKPTVFSIQIAQHFGINKYFNTVVGSEFDGTRTDKAEVIDYTLDLLNVSPSDAVMVGDREHDMIGAEQCGLCSVGVAYGYAVDGELEKAGAEHIVDSVEELAKLLENI